MFTLNAWVKEMLTEHSSCVQCGNALKQPTQPPPLSLSSKRQAPRSAARTAPAALQPQQPVYQQPAVPVQPQPVPRLSPTYPMTKQDETPPFDQLHSVHPELYCHLLGGYSAGMDNPP